MKTILTYILKSIVEKPDAIKVDAEEKEGIVYFTIAADLADYGKIIGKEGKIIRSIRNVMKIPAIKQGSRINISLAETTPQPAA